MENIFEEFYKECVKNGQTEWPEYTKDEFIEKAQLLFTELINKHSSFYEPMVPEEAKDDPSEEHMCPQCNGFLYYEAGGNIYDCNLCGGTGLNIGRELNVEKLAEWLEHEFIFSDKEVIELSIAKIKEK